MPRFKKSLKYTVVLAGLLTFYFMFLTDQKMDTKQVNKIIEERLKEFKKSEKATDEFHFEPTKQILAPSETKFNISNPKWKKKENEQFIFNMDSPHRLNKLFDLVYEKEKKIEPVLRKLGLVVFDDLINDKLSLLPLSFNEFRTEIPSFLQIVDRKVKATPKFIQFLNEQSNFYSFANPRKNVERSKIARKNEMPTIVTAANQKYFDALQATVYQIHKYLPDYRLIIYDLGLTPKQYKLTLDNCNCEIRAFDPNNQYANISSHIKNLHTYSWKPLIIQEALRDYSTVIYIDSSIRFLSSDMRPIIDTLKRVGMLTQFIGLRLTCYTDPKMFAWFGEEAESYEQFFTIEANILLFHQTFLTSLIMKAWITCALYEDCIAPKGAKISGCCGCHRFDQDAITIVNSYFYGHPIDSKNSLPAYSLTTQESYFFQVKRYEGRQYFTLKN
jgi:hypothetical protein